MKQQISVPQPQTTHRLKRIAIFGSADVDVHHPLYSEVFKVARYLAYHDRVIINGGGPGVMDAATKGAQAAGGETLVVTFYPKNMPEFEGRYFKNSADQEIKTATYIERMFGLMDHADAFVCFKGGTGTLSEWSTAWLLAHLYYGHHKPLILYGAFWKDVMRTVTNNFFIGEKELEVFKIVENEDELVKALDVFEAELSERLPKPPGDMEDKTAQLPQTPQSPSTDQLPDIPPSPDTSQTPGFLARLGVQLKRLAG